MILFLLILIAILIYACYDWKRTVIVWLPLSLLFNPCICIRYAPPALSLVLAVNLALIIIYFFKKEKLRSHLCYGSFSFHNSFTAYLISYSLSLLFSIIPFTTVFMATVKYFVNSFVIVFLFHKALKTTDDLKLFLRTAMLVIVPIIALSLYEVVFHDNPWLDFVYLAAPDPSYVIGKMYYIPPFLTYSGEMTQRFGMVRCYSFFDIHIAFGCACLLYLFLFLYFYQKKYMNIPILSIPACWVIIFLCIIGVVLSNSKTPMLGFVFFIIASVPVRKLFSIKGLIGMFVFLVLFYIALSYNENLFNNFFALFDSEIMEEGGGSSTALRIRQYEVGMSLFFQNPLFGNGIDSLNYLSHTYKYSDILGSESSWLKILPQQGIVGIVAYLILYYEMYSHLARCSGKRTAFMFCLGLLLMETATGFMTFAIYASIVIAIERASQIGKLGRKNKIEPNCDNSLFLLK